MNKLKAFVRLDFVTVKPYFTVKNLLIYGVIAAFLTVMSESIASGIGVGMMIGAMFMSYPFALGEKSNMDALYATLSVNRKTVVLGRYIFTLLLNAVAILVSVGLGMAGMLVMNRGDVGGIGAAMEIVLVLFALFLVIQSVQLPVYFKFGYAKAKFLTAFPFVALMVAYMVILRLPSIGNGVPGFLTMMVHSGMMIPAAIVVLLCVVAISYRLSLMFYRKREF